MSLTGTRNPGTMNARRQALVQRLLRDRGIEAASRAAAIRRRDPAEPPVLSFGQERLWILDRLDPGNWAYVICNTVRLGAVNGVVLEKALNAIVRRHETLRCNFLDDGAGRPRLVVHDARPLVLARVDLSRGAADGRLAEAARIADAEARSPFDLAADPLLRVTLIRMAPDDHLLVVSIHHIVSDAWSMDVFFNELFALYNAAAGGRPPPLDDLPIQYPDFAAWQRADLSGERLTGLLAYWRAQMAGAPPLIPLPTDKPRPAVRSGAGGRYVVLLEADVVEPLRRLARAAGATLYMALLAAFKVLLYRMSGEPRIVVGSPSANRNRSEIEGLIGFFVNTLVLHTDLSGDPGFREVLARVREVALGAAAHQDLPFERLVEELKPARSRAYNPVFQVLFNLQNGLRPVAAPQDPAAEAAHVAGAPKFDMEWALLEHAGGVTLTVEYSSDLYLESTIVALAACYRELILRAAAEPDIRLSLLAGGDEPPDPDDFDFDD